MNSSPRPSEERLSNLLHGVAGEEPRWRAFSASERGPDCPDESIWETYFAGGLSSHSDEALLAHAAGCRACGSRLLFWSATLDETETADERRMLDGLACLTPAWQGALAQRLAGGECKTGTSRRGGRVLLWSSMMGLAGAIAAGALFFLFLHNNRIKAPERQLAEAYSLDRQIELRIPLAEYGPLHDSGHTRGAGEAGHEAVPLLEARAAITQALLKTPEDPKWLLLQARADLLNQSYDSAIDTLRRLEVGDPKNVAVLTDLATAYSERARATDTPTDQAAALDTIEHAAQLAPQDPVVLYNEGLLLEQVYQYYEAADAWKKYLAVERNADWHADGQRHLDAVTARLAREKAKQSELAPYLASPDGMLHLARSPDLLAAHDEELSTIQISHLLQTAFPASPSSSQTIESAANCDAACGAARSLLSALAVSLEAGHHDLWLRELLAGAGKPGFAAAVNQLASAMAEDQHTHFAEALHAASGAKESFVKLGNQAGTLRAGLEALFADAHLLDDRACLAEAASLQPLQDGKTYPWMAAHYFADESSCHLQQNNFALGAAHLERSVRIAVEAKYGIEHLRGLSFQAAFAESQGDRALAWKLSLQGLRVYWIGDYPAVRKLQFYGNLIYAENASDRVYGATVLLRETTRMMAAMDLPQSLAVNETMLARAEIRAGEMDAGREAIQRGVNLSWIANDPARAQVTKIDLSSMLASAYLTSGDVEDAERELQGNPSLSEFTGNHGVELRYWLTRGQIALAERQISEADADLQKALKLAEDGERATTSWQERQDWMQGVRPVYASLVQLMLRQGRPPVEVLSVWERYRLFASGADLRKWCHEPGIDCLVPPVENFGKHLDGRVVLGTIRLDRSLLVWKLDDAGVRFHEVPIDPARFDLLSHAFAEEVASPDSSENGIRATGDAFSALLFQAFDKELSQAKEVVFDLDDTMEFLPVAALAWHGHYLGLSLPVSEVGSLLATQSASHASMFAGGKSLVIGASVPARTDLVPLPEAKAEAIAVAAELPQAKLLTGRQATPDAVGNALLDAELIHYAGHATVTEGTTRLMLAVPSGATDKNGSLDVQTIPRDRLAECRLFVLSACSTGNREDREAGDTANVAELLAAEGVRQTVATHWAVDSAASVIFMKSFYNELAAGKTVSVALMEAERQLSTQPGYRHPYFWASYSVFGMSRENLKELFHR